MTARSGRKSLRRLWSAEVVTLVAGVVQGLVVARELGPAAYGVYALLTTFAAFIFFATDPRSADAVVRYLAEFEKSSDVDKSRAVIRAGFILDMTWGLGGVLLVTALAVPAALVLNIASDTWLIPVAALGLATAAPAATSRAVLGVFDRFDIISTRQFGVAIIRALSVCAVALGGFGLDAIIWTLAGTSLLEGAIFVSAAMGVARRRLHGLRGGSIAMFRSRAREMVGFVGYSGLTTLASSAIKQVDTLIVGAIAGPREAGYYRLAKSLTAPAGNVGIPIQTVLYPRLAMAQSAGEAEQVDRAVRQTFIRAELPLAALALLAVPFIPLAVQVLAGEEFTGAVWPTIALVIGVAASFATLHQRPVFLVRSLLRPLLWFTLAVSGASVVLFVPASFAFGADGVAWARTAVVISGAFAMGIYLRSSRRNQR